MPGQTRGAAQAAALDLPAPPPGHAYRYSADGLPIGYREDAGQPHQRFNRETRRWEPVPEPTPRTSPVAGETAATATGKEVHRQRADERRASGDWDGVNEPIRDTDGNEIEVPVRRDADGNPADDRTQVAIPDAVSYERGVVLDDKPAGRPIRKDRQEIRRFIEAYERREGEPPEQVVIHRYDPETGEHVGTDVHDPAEFWPSSNQADSDG